MRADPIRIIQANGSNARKCREDTSVPRVKQPGARRLPGLSFGRRGGLDLECGSDRTSSNPE